MNPTNIIHILADINYPTTIEMAAIEWGCSIDLAAQRLGRGRRRGLLFREGRRHYSPNPELLKAWLKEGHLI